MIYKNINSGYMFPIFKGTKGLSVLKKALYGIKNERLLYGVI